MTLLSYYNTNEQFDMQNKQEEKGLITDNISKLPPCLSNQICFTCPIDGGHQLPLTAEKDPLQSLTSELKSFS